jgi:drug/metabolite transporter (DMT)-like permease
VITYINPAVAVILGVIFIGENITTGLIVGFPLVLLGSYLATRKPVLA